MTNSSDADPTPPQDNESLPALEKRVSEMEEHEQESKPHAAALNPPKPSFFNRVGSTLFSPHTSQGRFMRSLVRILALAVLFFALGAVVVYSQLYQPARQQYAALTAQHQTALNDLQTAQEDVRKANTQAEAAHVLAQDAQARLGLEIAHQQVLRAMLDLSAVRVAIAEDDKAAAQKAAAQAETNLKDTLAQVKTADEKQVASIQAIFTLLKNDIDRSPNMALQDLDRMQAELDAMQKNVLKDNPALWSCQCTAK